MGINVNAAAKDGITALHIAVSMVKEDAIRLLLSRKADVSVAYGPKGQLPIHILCSKGRGSASATLSILLRSGGKDMRLAKDKDGKIPLFLAAECDNNSMCRELLTALSKEQLKYKTEEGDTAMHIATRRKNGELLRLLLNSGGCVDSQNNEGLTPLHIACEQGDAEILKVFFQFRANANITDSQDRTPLHIAAEKGFSTIVETLADKFKASIFKRTKDGRTLMHIASESGHQETALVFLKKGVPLHMSNKTGTKAIHTAAAHGFVEVIRNLLDRGENVDATTPENFTALHLAVQANQPEVVEILLGHGANVQLKAGKNGETALHMAAGVIDGHKCAELIIKSGADVNAQNEEGETPLHNAARHGQLKTVTQLLEDGAVLDSLSKYGESVLHVAVKNCHYEIARSLVNHKKLKVTEAEVMNYVNEPNKNGETATHYASSINKNQIHYPTEDKDLIGLMLQNGGSVTTETKQTQETAIHYCCRVGNDDVLKEIISRLHASKLQIACNKQAANGWSPLLYACDSGHFIVVTLLLQNSARVDVFDVEGRAGLHLAAEHGHADVIEILLNHKAFVNVRTKRGMTPLHHAAAQGHANVVKLLVSKYGAAIDGLTLSKQTALHLAAQQGRFETCRLLLDLKADPNATDNRGQTPLLLAAENDHSEVVKLFLQLKPDLVTKASSSGITCGHIAAMKGSVAVIKGLMKFDPKLVTTARSKNNSTALHQAASGGNGEVVKVLLEAGANPSDETDEGYTALHIAAKYGHIEVLHALKTAMSWRTASKKTGLTALHVAASYGQEDFVREMLTQVPATILSERPSDNPDADYGFTPLHMASRYGREDVVRMLLNSAGVQVDASTTVEATMPLHLAARGGHLAVAGLILSRITDKFHSGDKKGRTPLHMAAAHGHEDIVRLLLGQGADINAADKNGWTALHYAAKQGYLDMIHLLIDSGASSVASAVDGKIPLSIAANANHLDVLRYLFKKEHNTITLMEDSSFLVDLMVCGKLHNQLPLLEFVFVSPAPIDTAVKMSRRYEDLAQREKERARDLENIAVFCETLASDLLAIAASNNTAGALLQAGDHKNTVFLDVLIELERKDVVAHSAVQKYLSDVWMGNLKWPAWQIILLFLAFIFCPVTWMACSLPLHRLANIPIIKFMSYLVSHIFLIFLLCFSILNPYFPLWSSARLLPHPHEWLLLFWLLGFMVAVNVNPRERGGLGWIKLVIVTFGMVAIVIHLTGFFFSNDNRLVIFYIRNQLLAVCLLLAFFEFLNFLTFHHLFGPWAIIIRDLMKDLMRFLAILAIFLTGFSLHICAVYQPVFDPGNKTIAVGAEVFQSPIGTFEMLFYALFGLVEPDYMPPMHLSPPFAKVIMKVVFGVYMMVTVIVLINLLIAMMSNTYQRIQSQSDKEWKYGRAKLIRNMNMTLPTPPPLNIVTFIPTLIQRWNAKKAGASRSGRSQPKLEKGTTILWLFGHGAARSWFNRKMRKRPVQVSPVDFRQGGAGGHGHDDLRPISSVINWKSMVSKYLEIKGIDMGTTPQNGSTED
ncbi:ankyrin-3-like [Uloborus diversus]|uniref:ankyrin-3-like n=1 Tax=Uloborus diversus TaxID=327109 RepID=UPI0024091797|nr:ankyrin-3-like [Uloborus diversus]